MLLLAIFMSFTACSTEEKKSDNQNKMKKNLVIALSNEPELGFDPCVGWGRDGNPLIQSTLLKIDTSMNIVNDLATGYTVSDDSLVWTFNIRDEVLFSSGEKLTAHDVAFTFETAKNSGSVVDLTMLKTIRVLNDTTIEFTLYRPQITFLTTIAQTGIVPAKYYSNDYAQRPIGSGPFTLLQWNRGEQVILGINEHYYGQKPRFERVTILFMSTETAYAASIRGDIDVALTNSNLAKNKIDGMSLIGFKTIDNRGITLPTVPQSLEKNSYGYSIGNNVTSDRAIRQALSYGIDRNALVQDCLNGFGRPAYSECDDMPWSSSDAYVDYNVELAKKILEDAGWFLDADGVRTKNGLQATFTILYNAADSIRQALSVAVAEQAMLLGINIEVEGTSWDEIEKRMHSNAVLMGFGSQNPMETYYLYHSSNKGKDFYNPEYYQNEQTDFYLETALSQTSYSDAYEYFKKVQWDGKQGVSTRGDIPFVWLVNVDHLYFICDNLDVGDQKIHPHGHDWPLLANLPDWVWKENE